MPAAGGGAARGEAEESRSVSMSIKLAAGAAVAAVVLMAWGAVFWMAIAPRIDQPRRLPGELDLVEAMSRRITEPGTYYFPGLEPEEGPGGSEFPPDWLRRHRAGPIGMLIYQPTGADPLDRGIFIKGYLHFLVSTVLAGIVLILALPSLTGYRQRVGLVFLVGLVAAWSMNLANPIWWHHPWGYYLHVFVYNVVGWLLAGLVMAGVIKPVEQI